ncbi:MAG: ATP-binding cassette domain-containing protein [Solirubrobacteraceae bacterium]
MVKKNAELFTDAEYKEGSRPAGRCEIIPAVEDGEPRAAPAHEAEAVAASQRNLTMATGGVASIVARGLSGSFSGIHPSLGKRARIGRDAENDLVVDDPLVSRFHAELRARPDGRRELVDLGSRNGTYVNGRAVERAIVEELDIVSIGHHTFRLVGTGLEEYVDTGAVTFEALGLKVRTPAGRRLLHDVTFRLEHRSFLGIVGPSGAGKSTLLNALTGFRPATEGRVLYDSRDMYREYDELRMRLGYVPQEDVMHAQLTVGQALDYGARLRFARDVGDDERHALIAEVLAQLGISEATDLEIHRLSGGQRRRVAVAMELVSKPSLLFLDEPTSGLDPGNERSLMMLLRELADGGRTVIAVTHSMQSIRMCDRLLVLAAGGRPAFFGRPQMAPVFFGCEDMQEVFWLLNADSERDWSAKLRADPEYARHLEVAEEPAERERREPEEPPRERRIRGLKPWLRVSSPRALHAEALRWSSHFSVLVRRYVRVIAGDRRNTALLVLQPVVLGVLMLAALPAHELAAPGAGQVRAVSRAGLVLLVVLLGATWLGASNAVREIVRELPILQRERAAGLGVVPYLGSKLVVLGTLTVIQCAVMALLALARQGSHDQGSLLASPLPEVVFAAVLAGLAGMTLGLLLSALASTADQAMTVLPVVLLLEMLLAMGGLFPDVVDKPVLKQLSYAAGTQWSFAAAASSVDLERMRALDDIASQAPRLRLQDPVGRFQRLAATLGGPASWKHEPGAYLEDAGIVLVISGTGAVLAGLAIRRRRPEA